jgi:hypothetical protein
MIRHGVQDEAMQRFQVTVACTMNPLNLVVESYVESRPPYLPTSIGVF